MKSFIISIIGILLLSSCHNKVENVYMFIGSDSELHFNSIVDSALVVPLEMKKEFIVGDVSKMNFIDSLCFILDKKTYSIYSFNEFGKYVGTLNKHGQGPEEYLSIYDFDIDRENKRINLLCYPPMIMITDLDFNLDSIIKLDNYFERIAVHDGEVYLYSDQNRSLNVLNVPDGKIEQKLVEKNMPQLFMADELVFHHIGNELLYIAVGSDIVHQIEDGQVKDLFVLDYDSKKTIKRLMKGQKQLSPQELLQYSPPRIQTIYKQKDEYCMIYTYKCLVRNCKLSTVSNQVLEDGLLINKSNNPILMYDNKLIAWEYIIDGEVSVDTKNSYLRPASEQEDLAVVMYTLKLPS